MLLFRKFKTSLRISERRNYSSSFKDEDKLGTICWCNWHSSFSSFKQNVWPSKYLYLLVFQGDLLNFKVILMFGLYVYGWTLPGNQNTCLRLHTKFWLQGSFGSPKPLLHSKPLFSNAALSFIVSIPWPASLIATEEGMVIESKCPEFQNIKGQKDTGAEQKEDAERKNSIMGNTWSQMKCPELLSISFFMYWCSLWPAFLWLLCIYYVDTMHTVIFIACCLWVLYVQCVSDVSVSATCAYVDDMWYACIVSAVCAMCEYYEFRVWVLCMQCVAAMCTVG